MLVLGVVLFIGGLWVARTSGPILFFHGGGVNEVKICA